MHSGTETKFCHPGRNNHTHTEKERQKAADGGEKGGGEERGQRRRWEGAEGQPSLTKRLMAVNFIGKLRVR